MGLLIVGLLLALASGGRGRTDAEQLDAFVATAWRVTFGIGVLLVLGGVADLLG